MQQLALSLRLWGSSTFRPLKTEALFAVPMFGIDYVVTYNHFPEEQSY